MSGYQGRAGPNFSDFLNNLNTVSPPEYQFPTEEPDFSQDLAMFTNADFTHIDVPPLPEDGSFNFDLSTEPQGQNNVKYEELLAGPVPSRNYNNAAVLENQSPGHSAHYFSNYNTPIQPAPTHGFPPVENPPRHASVGASRRGKAESITSPDVNPEEGSRVAAEEDKRRRNTAASARFRVKKKQREQALEKTAKEIQDKNAKLEAKISQLEMENQWLKNLITEKNGIQSKEEIAAAYQKYRKESEERDLKAEPEHATGVGTN